MAIINQAIAQPMLQAYVGSGTPSHFTQANGNKINGYVFSRSEISGLIAPGQANHLYVMMGMITDSDPAIGTYITPIIGKLTSAGLIDPNQLVIASAPNTSPLNISTTPVSPNGVGAGGQGYPISIIDAQRMIDYHLIGGQPLNLNNANGQKIRAFNLNDEDLNFLLNNDNGGDLLLMPALKDQDYTGAGIPVKHITFILSWLSGSQVHTPSLYEYIKPCPSVCHTF